MKNEYLKTVVLKESGVLTIVDRGTIITEPVIKS